MRSSLVLRFCLLAVLLSAPALLFANVKLPALFGDNMVLQQGVKTPVWGWADAGEAVTVTLGAATAKATPGEGGKWMVKLDAMPAGGPFEMTVAGKNTLTVKNLLVGEVWVASGQSNMEMSVYGVRDAQAEMAAANYPNLRMFTVQKISSAEPQADCRGSWQVCSPQTVGGFSAVGYFFARDLQKVLNVPIGIIHTSWGGTPAQSWTDRQSLLAKPDLKPFVDATDQTFAVYSKALAELFQPWLAAYNSAVAAGQPAPLPPSLPADPRGGGTPMGLYNGMVAPLLPYAIEGAIWYQGESNAGNPVQYRTLFPAMIQGWRRVWGQGDFPFLFVQLANYMALRPDPGESGWAELREAQTMTLRLPKTGMATIIDIGMGENIHPVNKQDVGGRLALAARKVAYGQDLVYSGPTFDKLTVEGAKARITFANVGGGLVAKDAAPLRGFAICGEDKKFVWADAVLEGKTVVVSSAQVPAPVAVRYAWADNPLCNLYNQEGLPAVPFRTDAPEPPAL